MKFLILNADYYEFMRWLYAKHPRLEKQPYEKQTQARAESFYGVADFYSGNLRKLGHEAWDIRANNVFIQRAWAREHDVPVSPSYYWHFLLRRNIVPWVERVRNRRWFYEILAAQIKYFKPDILLNQAMDGIGSQFLREIKPYVRLLIGQIASPVPEGEDFGCYDLIISSLDNFVEYFRKQNIPSERLNLGFEPRVLDGLDKTSKKSIPVSFVGGLSGFHEERVRILEYLRQKLDMQIWGMVIENLSPDLRTRRCYKGEAWGYDMYQILQNSKITLNHHGRWAGPYANNCRLYEATGVGTLLITDWKVNLHELFEPGKEVVAYHTPEECEELVRYYLEHEEERESIAKAGQQRTLRDYTYYQRMQELINIVHKYL